MFEDKVIPLDTWVSQFVDWLVDNHRDIFQALKWPVEKILNKYLVEGILTLVYHTTTQTIRKRAYKGRRARVEKKIETI